MTDVTLSEGPDDRRRLTFPSRRTFLAMAGASLGAAGLAACSSGSAPAAEADDGAAPAPAGGGEPGLATPASVPDPESGLEQSGLLWTGARLLMATVAVDEAAARTWIPPGMELASPATATFFVAHYPLTQFGSVYNEGAVLLHIEDATGPAWHCPWMVVDDDTALILGREMLGFPKKMADITLDEGSDTLVGTVSRKDTEVLRIELPIGALTAEGGGVWTNRIVNVHGTFVGGMRLLEVKPLTETVHDRLIGTATVTLGSSDRDPLGGLVPEPAEGEALFAVLDFAELANGGVPSGDVLPADWAWPRQMAWAL